MKYVGMPLGMWALFSQSFCCQLTAVFGYDKATAKAVTQKAKPKYKEIIHELPPFETVSYTHLDVYKRQDLASPA